MKQLPYIDANSIAANLSHPELLLALKQAFLQNHQIPDRLHYDIGKQWGIDATLLIMVAWGADRYLGVKLATLYPDNPTRRMAALAGVYVLFDGANGRPLALLDAAELTAWRTAAVSMLAATALLSSPARNVLILGAGKLAKYFVHAYCEIIRPERIFLWSREAGKAEQLAASIQTNDSRLAVAYDLEQAVRQADCISTLTSSSQPLFPGAWCQPGCHLDLVGGYRSDMREADDHLIRRAVICVDSYRGALLEAGDIIDPLGRGVISRTDIQMELAELLSGKKPVRTEKKDLTVFKSVGTALEDLAAAIHIYKKVSDGTHS